jgi:tripartite-type tricarboxylate transporter receptor subunit TctC
MACSCFRRSVIRSALLAFIATGAWFGSWPCAATAQAPYPNRSIRIVSPLAAGSVSDISLRVIGERLSQHLRVPVVIENQPGTGGVAAARTVMNSQPDGYTVGLGGNNWAISIGLFKNFPFDPRKDLTPIVGLIEFAYVFVTNQNSKYHTLNEVIAAGRANTPLTFGTSSAGTTNHLAALLFKSVTELNLVVVPYRGPAELSIALLRNDVDVVINAYGGLRQGIERKEIRALATTTAARIPQLPEVPTAREAGVADFEVSSWNGLYAPVGTPPDVVATLSKAITEVLAEKDIQQRHRELGLEVSPTPGDQLAKRMRSESDRWGKVINESGIEQQ